MKLYQKYLRAGNHCNFYMFFCASITYHIHFFPARKNDCKKYICKATKEESVSNNIDGFDVGDVTKRNRQTEHEMRIKFEKNTNKIEARITDSSQHRPSSLFVSFFFLVQRGGQTHSLTHRSRLPLKSILLQLAQAASRGSGYMHTTSQTPFLHAICSKLPRIHAPPLPFSACIRTHARTHSRHVTGSVRYSSCSWRLWQRLLQREARMRKMCGKSQLHST